MNTNFQEIFENLPIILPSMDFQRHGAQWWSPRNADGSFPAHARKDKTVLKSIGGVIVAAENGGWGCHRLTAFLKLHFSEQQLREVFAKFSDKKSTPIHVFSEIQILAVEFLQAAKRQLTTDGEVAQYIGSRGFSVDEVFKKTNIGGYVGANEKLRTLLEKMHISPKEFERLNSCKSVVLPLFSRGVLTGVAFRYLIENRTPKCEKIRLSERYGGLCFQHASPQPDVTAVCVVEGEFDAISANLIRSPNPHFVATCGHANAENAVKEIRRIYPNADIFAAFDNDETGTSYVTEFQQVDNTIADIRAAFAPSKDINEFIAKGGDFQRILDEISVKTKTPFTPVTLSEIWNTARTDDFTTDFPIFENGVLANLILPMGVTIIAAPTGHGKSTILQNMALREASCGNHVLYLTIEESRENVLFYLFSAFCASRGVEIAALKIRRREVDIMAEYSELVREFDRILKSNLIIDNFENSAETLVTEIAKHTKHTHIDAVFIDYVQLLFSETPNTRNELQIKAIMKALRTISDTLHVRVVVAAQFNRSASQDFEKMTLYNIGEGGDIERAASLVISIFQLSQIEGREIESDTLSKLMKEHTERRYDAIAYGCGMPIFVTEPKNLKGCVFVKILKNRIGIIGASAVWKIDFSTRYVLAKIRPKQTEIAPTPNADIPTNDFAKIAANFSHFDDIF